VIWLTNSHGKRIPSFFVECSVDERTGEGMRAPHPGEVQQHFPSHHQRGMSTDSDRDGQGGVGGGGYNSKGGGVPPHAEHTHPQGAGDDGGHGTEAR